jgi:hypothetical protein
MQLNRIWICAAIAKQKESFSEPQSEAVRSSQVTIKQTKTIAS